MLWEFFHGNYTIILDSWWGEWVWNKMLHAYPSTPFLYAANALSLADLCFTIFGR